MFVGVSEKLLLELDAMPILIIFVWIRKLVHTTLFLCNLPQGHCKAQAAARGRNHILAEMRTGIMDTKKTIKSLTFYTCYHAKKIIKIAAYIFFVFLLLVFGIRLFFGGTHFEFGDEVHIIQTEHQRYP